MLGWTRPIFLHLKPVSACALLFVPRPSRAHVSYAFKIEAVAYCADFTHEDTSILLQFPTTSDRAVKPPSKFY